MTASFTSGSPASNPWKLGGLTLAELVRRVWDDIQKVDLLGRAAQLAFYLVLAMFPALLFLTALIGLFPLETRMPELVGYLSHVLPADALSLLTKFLQHVMQGSGTDVLSLGLLGALWASSSGVTAIIDALNAAYSAKETRPLWKIRVLALALTIGLAGFIVGSVTLLLYGEHIGSLLAVRLGMGGIFVFAWAVMKWPVVCLLMLFAAAVIYCAAPNVRQNWRWVTPGSLVGLALWLAVSLGFKTYVDHFGNYNAVYGSIAGVMILMLWMYLSGMALLLGGDVNATIEKAANDIAQAESKPLPLRQAQ